MADRRTAYPRRDIPRDLAPASHFLAACHHRPERYALYDAAGTLQAMFAYDDTPDSIAAHIGATLRPCAKAHTLDAPRFAVTLPDQPATN